MPFTPYSKNTWINGNPATPMSAARLAHTETQYDEAMQDVEASISDAATPIGAALNATYVAAFADTVIGYDGDGNVDEVTEGGILTTYTYNADGTVDTDTRLGVTRQYTYDGSGNLTGIEAV